MEQTLQTRFQNFELFWENFQYHVLGGIASFKLIDLIDIIVLSFILYMVWKFILNKRAARLLVGLLVIGCVLVVSLLLDMKATSFIFSSFNQVGVLALIIMFQPELRSVLEKIGNAPISNIKSISNDNRSSSYIANSIGIITDTVCDLSMEKTGAIIIIERETKLGEYIKTGTLVNAQLSSQLLKNIFYNKAPLHDGAVILRGYRIYSAGCFLPLSTKDDIDENFGTRHRAAIGISEVSDAVAIVVSEETGRISIAIDGELRQNYSQKTLKKELSKILIPNTKKQTQKSTPNETNQTDEEVSK